MIYVYMCECGFEKDEVHGMYENPEIKCDKCGKAMNKKITGGTGFILKGSGWSNSLKRDDDLVKSVHPQAHKMHKEGKI